MLAETLSSPRAAAQEIGIPWSHVVAAARELREHAIEKRRAMDGARRVAWENYCHRSGRSRGCHSFWRCGFDHVFRSLERRGRDYTSIRAYDEIATAVAAEFPEWRGETDALWAWLAESYEPLPAASAFYNAALDMLERVRMMRSPR